MSYRLIDHTADTAIEVTGVDMKSLFANCGYALFDILYDTKSVRCVKNYEVTATGAAREALLINFLRELFIKFVVYKIVLREIEITALTGDTCTATVRGEVFSPARHKQKADIKAVTYHNVKITGSGAGLKVSIVFDT